MQTALEVIFVQGFFLLMRPTEMLGGGGAVLREAKLWENIASKQLDWIAHIDSQSVSGACVPRGRGLKTDSGSMGSRDLIGLSPSSSQEGSLVHGHSSNSKNLENTVITQQVCC